ncbi:MAG: hypothetical protein HFH90_13505 [Lachnospiraceae bacterium]|jgi:hypothetical protein|nr:hypothetical protein [Lachnospiraceae bacterium]
MTMTAGKWQRNARGAASIWALLARSSIYKLLALAAVMALGEAALFYISLRGGRGYELTDVINSSKISTTFLAALGLWLSALAGTERNIEEKSGNTINRLTLSRRGIFWVKAVFNIGCLVILFALQIWIAIWMVGAFGRERPEAYASPQRLFLAFYRIEFLHCLLPLAEAGKWVRNVFLVLALGMEAAAYVKGVPLTLLLLYFVTAGWFVGPVGGGLTDALCILVCVAVMVSNVWRLWKKDA